MSGWAVTFRPVEWFERLCYRLTRLQGTIEQCRIFGVGGQTQHGIDLHARKWDGTYLVVQCKRSTDEFTPGEVTSAVDDFLKGEWAAKANEFVLAVTEQLERTQVATRIEDERPRHTSKGIRFTVWDQTELSTLLKDQPRLVDDFFGREAVRVFAGEDAATALGTRLATFVKSAVPPPNRLRHGVPASFEAAKSADFANGSATQHNPKQLAQSPLSTSIRHRMRGVRARPPGCPPAQATARVHG